MSRRRSRSVANFVSLLKNTNDGHFQHHLTLKTKILPFCIFHIIISNIHGCCEKKMDALRHFPHGQTCHWNHVKIAFLSLMATLKCCIVKTRNVQSKILMFCVRGTLKHRPNDLIMVRCVIFICVLCDEGREFFLLLYF